MDSKPPSCLNAGSFFLVFFPKYFWKTLKNASCCLVMTAPAKKGLALGPAIPLHQEKMTLNISNGKMDLFTVLVKTGETVILSLSLPSP
jgi:hypothetical protein